MTWLSSHTWLVAACIYAAVSLGILFLVIAASLEGRRQRQLKGEPIGSSPLLYVGAALVSFLWGPMVGLALLIRLYRKLRPVKETIEDPGSAQRKKLEEASERMQAAIKHRIELDAKRTAARNLARRKGVRPT